MRYESFMRASLVTLSVGITSLLLAAPAIARAQNVIEQPGAHPPYTWELEPHLGFTVVHHGFYTGGRAGYATVGDTDLGLGFRGTYKLVDPGFIPKINNTVGISLGVDLTQCRFWCADSYFLYAPEVGAQWNFFFTDKFSALTELGLVFVSAGSFVRPYAKPYMAVGGRYHLSKTTALTLHLGDPFTQFGVSFFM
jgi:hypothetical protein